MKQHVTNIVNMNTLNAQTLSSDISPKIIDIPALDDYALQLKKYFDTIRILNVKGKENILSLMKEFNIELSYSAVMYKLGRYIKEGPTSLIRKSDPRKDEIISFSPEALQKLQSIFTDSIRGGSAMRAYEDMHKYFRMLSTEFALASTGECFAIENGILLDVQNNKILSHLTTLFEAGTYTLKSDISSKSINVGSYSSAARFLSKIKKDSSQAIYLARFGIYDYRNKRQHSMKINYSNLKPNDLIIGDGKKLDILVISEDWKRIYRPYLMGWYDAATRRYCYEISESETAESICNSLSTAIRQWGLPKLCKHDNGKSYLSKRFLQMKESIGINTTLAKVKLARAKPIESFHNILDNLLCTSIGYVGNKYQNFPEDTRRRLKLVAGMQKNLNKLEKIFKEEKDEDCNFINLPIEPEARLKFSKNRFMHISELLALLDTKLNEYHERQHGGLSVDKLGKEVNNINCTDSDITKEINSPNGRYNYYVKKGFCPVQVSPQSIAIYAMNTALRTVHLKTGISLHNEEYYHPALYKLAGDKVLIRYSRYAPEYVYIFHSPDLQKIADIKQLTPDIQNTLNFFCLADKQNLIDYGDPAYLDKLIEQKEEEKTLRLAIASRPDAIQKNIIQMNPLDSHIANINEAEINYKNHKQIQKIKYKKLNDD